MPIGQGVKLIGRAHQGLVSFWGDPSCHGLQRNKTQYEEAPKFKKYYSTFFHKLHKENILHLLFC